MRDFIDIRPKSVSKIKNHKRLKNNNKIETSLINNKNREVIKKSIKFLNKPLIPNSISTDKNKNSFWGPNEVMFNF